MKYCFFNFQDSYNFSRVKSETTTKSLRDINQINDNNVNIAVKKANNKHRYF